MLEAWKTPTFPTQLCVGDCATCAAHIEMSIHLQTGKETTFYTSCTIGEPQRLRQRWQMNVLMHYGRLAG